MPIDTKAAREWFDNRIEYFAVKHPDEVMHVETIRHCLEQHGRLVEALRLAQKHLHGFPEIDEALAKEGGEKCS